MPAPSLVSYSVRGAIAVVTIERPEVKNAVDQPTRQALAEAFRQFDAEPAQSVAILTGAGGAFCAGADLKARAAGRRKPYGEDGDGPIGPTRMKLSKPVIAAIEGPAVAGGLELALWCDLRVVEDTATLGVFCRRFGVPLIDGGTIRLPRLIGLSRALDLILTGRAVDAHEALAMGLVNRVVPAGTSREAAEDLARELAGLPQQAMLGDRMSAYLQHDLPLARALGQELELGARALGEAAQGAARFSRGAGRHGGQA